MYGKMSVSTMRTRLCPDSLERLTWSRLRSEMTCERTERVVHVQLVNPMTSATTIAPRFS